MNRYFLQPIQRLGAAALLILVSTFVQANVTLTHLSDNEYNLDWPTQNSSCMNAHYKIVTIVNGTITHTKYENFLSYTTVTTPEPSANNQWVTFQVFRRVCNPSGSSYIFYGAANITINAIQQGVIPRQTPTLATIPSEDILSTEIGLVGGQFRVNESGAATYYVPIMLPNAPGNIKPEVGISYSSDGGNGVMGIGWAITGLSGVSRCRQTKETFDADNSVELNVNDRYCLDGQPLVLQSGTYGHNGATYTTEIFSGYRVTSVGGTSGNPSIFKVEKEDGSTWYYGENNNAKLITSQNKNVTWALTSIEDNVQNTINYSYRKSAGTGFGANEILIDEITFGDHTINFVYNNGITRSDTNTSYVHGIKVERKAILTDIIVENHQNIDLVSYHFDYTASSTHSRNSKLIKIDKCDGSISGVCVQPDTFDYTDPGNYGYFAGYDTINLSDQSNVLASFPLDYNGDGLTDWIYAFKQNTNYYRVRVYKNTTVNGAISFTSSPYRDYYINAVTSPSATNIMAIDHDNDSVVDLLVPKKNGSATKWYVYTDDGDVIDTGLIYQKNTAIADINGDGRADIVTGEKLALNTANGFEVKHIYQGNLGNNMLIAPGSLKLQHSQPIDLDHDGRSEFYLGGLVETINDTFEDEQFLANLVKNGSFYEWNQLYSATYQEKVQYADINQDGLTDTFKFNQSQNKWQLRLSTNGASTNFQNINLFNLHHAASVQILDTNGDGYMEIGYVDTINHTWRTASYIDGSWHHQATHSLLGAVSPNNSATGMADFDGNGRADMYTMDYGSNKRVMIKRGLPAYTLSSQEPVDKIKTFTNGFGTDTHVRYMSMLGEDGLSIGKIYTKGYTTDNFGSTWGKGSHVANIIGPIFLVREVSSDAPGYNGSTYDPNNTLSVQYAYNGLRMQAGGRGSLGFYKLLTKDVQTGVETETTYAQYFPYIGMPKRTTTKLNNTVLSDAENVTLETKVLKSLGANNGQALFPYIASAEQKQYVFNASNDTSTLLSISKTTTTYEAQPSTSAPLYFTLTDTKVDTYNAANQRLKTTLTHNTYVDENIGNWWINRLSSTTVTKELTGLAGQTADTKVTTANFTYYNNSHGMLETEKVGVDASNTLITKHCYASNGMKLNTITYSPHYEQSANCEGYRPTASDVESDELKVFRESRVSYDNQFRFIEHTYNGLNFALNATSNPNKWSLPQTIQQYTDNNQSVGVTTDVRFDRFGNQFFKRDTTGKFTRNISRFSSSASSIGAPSIAEPYYFVTKTSSAGNAPVFAYFDQLGRQVATVSKGFDGTNVYQYQRYNIQGRAYKSSIASFQSYGEHWSTTIFDPLGNPYQVSDANGTVTSTYQSVYSGKQLTTSTITYSASNVTNPSIVKKELRNVHGELVVVDDNNNGLFEDNAGSLRMKYDASSNLIEVINVDDVTSQTINYDDYGRKISMSDVSKGDWTYGYNALGELVKQVSPINDETITYRDLAGRIVKKTTSVDTPNISESIEYQYSLGNTLYLSLQDEQLIEGSIVKYEKLYAYDSFNRLDWVKTKIDGTYYVQQTTFDEFGRVYQQFDPQVSSNGNRDRVGCFNDAGIEIGECKGIQNRYNDYGYLYIQSEADEGLAATGNHVFYRITGMNALGKVTGSEQGAHITNTRVFDEVTGLPVSHVVMSGSTVIQDNDYDFDGIGTLRSRQRYGLKSSNAFYSEEFNYDLQNRLTHIDGVEHVQYHANGNIKWKKAVDNGTSRHYCYRSDNPYAVSGLGSNGCTSNSYLYDEKGNMESGKGRTITYSHFDKATKIEKGSDFTDFSYDSSRSRYKRVDKIGTETKETHYIGNIEVIYTSGSSVVQTRRYIPGGITNQYGSNPSSFNFEHKDHLGSANTITDGSGKIVTKLAFDAWGKKFVLPMSQWSSSSTAKAATNVFVLNDLLQVTKRGYTGHEHIDNMDIIHMNGRIYDPTLGRFLQADPFIQAPNNSQNYNRYSYVLNNPMSYTDPSGYFFKSLFKKLNKALGDFAPLLGIALLAIPGIREWTLASGWHAALFGFGTGGVATGSLKGALIGAFSGAAFHQIGGAFTEASGFFAEGGFGHILTHGVTGGITSVLSGGKFGHGFLSAGLTKALNINKMIGVAAKDAGLRIVTAAVVGGTISKISGGKFANGAVTAAFAQALNGEQGAAEKRRQDRLARSRVTTTMSSNDETNEHVYKISGKICDAAAEGCNAALADKVYDEVNRNDIPFSDDDMREGRHYLGPLDDPITHRQSSALRTSVNIAEEGHTFYPGTVTHQVHFRDGALYYDLTGVGTGQLPAVNNHVGEFLFRPGVVRVVRNHGF